MPRVKEDAWVLHHSRILLGSHLYRTNDLFINIPARFFIVDLSIYISERQILSLIIEDSVI